VPHRSVLDPDIKRKIALFCDVDEEAVITAKDVSTIYEVPLVLAAEGLDRIVLSMHLAAKPNGACRTGRLDQPDQNPLDDITIHVVGKYVGYEDSYKSLNGPCITAGSRTVESQHQVDSKPKRSRGPAARRSSTMRAAYWCGGIRQSRHTGMMKAAQVARERGIPFYFGICYGFSGRSRVRAKKCRGARRCRLHRMRTRHADQS